MENEKYNEQLQKVKSAEDNNKIVIYGYDGYVEYDINEFLMNNTVDNILEKLYRTKENTITRGRRDSKWVNDYALVSLFMYVMKQNEQLKNELQYYKEKNIPPITNNHQSKKYVHMGEKFETGQNIGI